MPGKKSKLDAAKRPYHHGDLRSTLMQEALRLIDQHGVKGFSLKDAAAMAGVSTAAPYRHFDDKEALLRAIQSEGFALFDASLSRASALGLTPQSRIEELGVAYVLFALNHPSQFRVMFSLAAHGQPKPDEQHESAGFRLLVDAVDELHPGAGEGDRTSMVLACWSLVHGFALLYLDGAFEGLVMPPSLELQLRQSLRLFTAGPAIQAG